MVGYISVLCVLMAFAIGSLLYFFIQDKKQNTLKEN